MAAQLCCVDHARLGVKQLGGRWFCEEHYRKATYHRTSFWQSGAIALVGILVYVGAVVALELIYKPELTGFESLIAGLLLALLPIALWGLFFYRQDAVEPEPMLYVARIFIVGFALASALGVPFTDQLFHVQNWLYRDNWTTLLGSIFVIGVAQAFVIYVTVRFFIYDSPEFDERIDGVIYATAAALGYATALNVQFILANPGAALGPEAVYLAESALGLAAFGGLLGYFLGHARVQHEPVWWLGTGFAATAILGGLFLYLRGQVDTGTFVIGAPTALPSFIGLALAGVLAVAVAVAVSLFVRRDIRLVLSGKAVDTPVEPGEHDRKSNLVALATVAVMLIIGLAVWNNAVNATRAFDTGGFRGAYPSYFSFAKGQDPVVRLTDNLGTGSEFLIAKRPLAQGQDANGVAQQLAGERSTDFDVYKVLDKSTTRLGGKPALVQRFAFVDPKRLTGAAPEVNQGLDYIVTQGGQAIIITLITTPQDAQDVEPLFARFLNSLSF